MSVNDLTNTIQGIKDAKEDLRGAINAKGGTLAEDAKLNEFKDAVEGLPSGETKYELASTIYDGGTGVLAIKAIVVKQGTTSIVESAYSGTGIESLEIPSSVTTYGHRICKDCKNLKSVLFPENLTFVPAYFFQGCLALTSYTVEERFKRIETAAFYNCKNIKKFEVLGGLDYIGDYAFEACFEMKHIKLKKVVSIQQTAFFNLHATVIIDSLSISTINGVPKVGSNFRLYVPDEVVGSYKSATNWSSISSKIYPLSEYTES